MGRGRAKAKQTKVARDLKYRTHETDFSRLQAELRGQPDGDGQPDGAATADVDEDELEAYSGDDADEVEPAPR